jgi:hypothetical protein
MTHSSKARAVAISAASFLWLASFGLARTAEASQEFPALLQAALQKKFGEQISGTFCVPLCTACHLTTVGGPGNLNVFGADLMKNAGLQQLQDATVASSLDTLFATPPPPGAPLNAAGEVDSDGDGISDKQELIDFDSPSLPAPRGEGAFCPDIKYGCAGGRIAPAPPRVDHLSLFSAGLIVLGFAAIRRRRGRALRAR